MKIDSKTFRTTTGRKLLVGLFFLAGVEAAWAQVPAGHRDCAKDGGKCEITGAWTGFYGAGSTFVPISGTGAFTCLPGNLKVADPVPNVQKTCYVKAVETEVSSVPAGHRDCAKDGGKCEVTGNWTGYYGAGSKFVPISGSGGFTCLPGNLKVADPVPNVQKTCFVKTVETAAPTASAPAAAPAAGKCPTVKKGDQGLLVFWLTSEDKGLVKFKAELQKGSDPETYFSGSGLPQGVLGNVLGAAAYNCKPEHVQAMLDACADANASYAGAKKPLDLAKMANGGQGCPAVIAMLEKAGATVTAVAPLAPKTYPSLVIAATEADYNTMKSMIASKKWDIELTSSRGETALTVAVGYGNLDAVKALLEGGASPNQILTSGYHSLHLLVQGGADENGDLRIHKNAPKIAMALWEKCTIRRPVNKQGQTPLEMLKKKAKGTAGAIEITLANVLQQIHDGPAPGTKCP